MNIHFNEVWSEARVARLTELWAAGWSASRIAADIGTFQYCEDGGRSAVLGKIHRLRLPPPEGKTTRAPRPYGKRQARVPSQRGEHNPLNRDFSAVPPPATSQGRIRNVTRLQAKANGHDPGLPKERRNPSHNILAAIAIAKDEPGLPERLKGEMPNGTGIKFADLTSTNCHWPKGDPASEDFEFCGAAALSDKPYCSHHSRIAYLPSSRAARGV